MKPHSTSRREKIEEELKTALPSRLDAAWIERALGPGGLGEEAARVPLEAWQRILDPARELIERGGKRWRPMVMLLSCELVGGGERALPLAPLVELAHNGSLIVDDIEDKADWRRGGPSVHVRHGEDTAINSGSLLYFLPALLIDRSPFSAEEKATFHRYYGEDMRRLHFGQGLDIQWHRDHLYRPSRSEYLAMCRLKTGSLVRLAARIGVVAGGGTPEIATGLGELCERMGVAFQILDDVRNLTSGNPGKKRGDDIVEGKKSLPVIIHLEGGAEGASRLIACFESARAEGVDSPSVERAIELLRGSGSIEGARETAERMLAEATDAIKLRFAESEARSLLLGLFGGLLA